MHNMHSTTQLLKMRTVLGMHTHTSQYQRVWIILCILQVYQSSTHTMHSTCLVQQYSNQLVRGLSIHTTYQKLYAYYSRSMHTLYYTYLNLYSVHVQYAQSSLSRTHSIHTMHTTVACYEQYQNSQYVQKGRVLASSMHTTLLVVVVIILRAR